jgi:molybdenum cofactor cytidylyltransferase
VFPALADLHGDKGVWRLLDQRAGEVANVPVAGPIPLDVDTPEDYRAVLAALAAA